MLLVLYVVTLSDFSMTEKMAWFEYLNMHSAFQITETRWLGHLWKISNFPVATQLLHVAVSRLPWQRKSSSARSGKIWPIVALAKP